MAPFEELGEAAVLADLERAGIVFTSSSQKRFAWEWVYARRGQLDTERHLREHRLWWVAFVSAIASVVSALTALVALYVTR